MRGGVSAVNQPLFCGIAAAWDTYNALSLDYWSFVLVMDGF